jgi:soluble lytic murein transglycosylase-like protein
VRRPPRPRPDAAKEQGSSATADEAAPVEQSPSTVEEIIAAAASEFGIDAAYLLAVARCESDLDPNATSPAGYHGLFQFDLETWSAYGYGPIYDPVAQARTAARLLAAGEAERWPNCA